MSPYSPSQRRASSPSSSTVHSGRTSSTVYSVSSYKSESYRPIVDYRKPAKVHFDEFQSFLAQHIARELLNWRSSAREKLTRLTKQQFHELSTDVYDELIRQNKNGVENNVPFLPMRDDFHLKRNQARMKLATLPNNRFKDLSGDVFFELGRRYPEFKENELPPAPESGVALIGLAVDIPLPETPGVTSSTSSARPDDSPVDKWLLPCKPQQETSMVEGTQVLDETLSEENAKRIVRDVFAHDSEHCLDGRVTRRGQHPVAFGGNADVWEGLLGTQKVAIKTLRPFSSVGKRIEERKLLKRLWREYVTWTRVTHPVVLQCLGFSYDFTPEPYVFPSLISPWLSNGTLPAYLEKCPDADRCELLTTVAEALSFLHSRQPPIIHGDLRGDNILVSDSGRPCLSDFGHSRIFKLQGMSTTSEVAGTVRWMSPELLCEDIVASESSDVWAYGMTVLEILSGQVPYHDVKGPGAVLTQIILGHTPSRPQDASRLTDEIWIICQQCWIIPTGQRPDMKAVYLGMIGASIPSAVAVSRIEQGRE